MFFILDENSNNIPRNCTAIQLKDPSKLIFLCTFLQSNYTVKVLTELQELFLGDNQIGDEGARAIAKVLEVNHNVTKLYLGWNEIGDEGAKAIAEALKVNRTITGLHLTGNKIGAEGAKAFLKALRNYTITELNLGANKFRNKEAKAIAEELKVNWTVTGVYLEQNELGNDGAKTIAEVLKVNGTIKKLDLSCNRIGVDGAKAIIEALKVNCTVVTLNLWDNLFSVYERMGEEEKVINKELHINWITEKELTQEVADTQCKTIALGVFPKIPIYVLLDILELVIILDLERKTNSHKFYNNHLFLKLLENKVSKKRLLSIMDKIRVETNSCRTNNKK